MSNLTIGEIYKVNNVARSTDFIGFTFNGVHSSELEIVRTSGGNRYQENLFPSVSDRTAQVSGGDGVYYFGSDYTQKVFSISFAFDSLTEILFRKLKQWLNPKEIGLLTFDEEPYKSYRVKTNDGVNIQYICFDQDGERIYKGEGNIQFTAFYPYGICFKKYLDLYGEEKYPNKKEWAESSGLLKEQGIYDGSGAQIEIYNPGDFPTDFQAFYRFDENGIISLNSIYISTEAGTKGLLNFSKPFEKKKNDIYLRINSKTELIEGCDENKETTGTLYNEYISTGDFFKIPIIIDITQKYAFTSANNVNCENLEYNYLYY